MKLNDVWRQAALEGRPQFYGTSGTMKPGEWPVDFNGRVTTADCGMSVLPAGVISQLCEVLLTPFKCLVEDCDYQLERMLDRSMIGLIIHLNNHHRWGWLDFANKFPEIDVRDDYNQAGLR